MYFHVDESGNTGNNLFDASQPILSYGLLSSRDNVDVAGVEAFNAMRSKLGVDSLHAANLGIDRIESIAPLLVSLHETMAFQFDYYFINKPTYALVQFFEAVYDAGLNEAVAWMHYWTPIRFYLIGVLGEILDEDFLRKSWSLSSERRISTRLDEVSRLLLDARQRISESGAGPRLKEVLIEPLNFGIRHPDKLDFGAPNPKIISPNAVAFQFVVNALARHVRNTSDDTAVVVTIDHQQQFNSAQLRTYDYQRMMAEGFKKAPAEQKDFILNHPLFQHLDREEVFATDIPIETPIVARSAQSIGLQIVDIYLWLANRFFQGMDLPSGVNELTRRFLRSGQFDGIWMDGMLGRWRDFEAQLPGIAELTAEQISAASATIESHRAHVASLALGDME